MEEKIMIALEGALTKSIAAELTAFFREHEMEDTPKAAPKKRTKKYGKDAIRHSEMDDIITALREGDHVFLAGPAGTGKSQLAEMIAEELGLDFYMSSQVTQEYKIEGYGDAYGVFHTTAFIEAFTKGGLFLMDEADASSPDVLVILNTALANGYMNVDGKLVFMHKDFKCVATGNTFGTGADEIYVGRQSLDASTLDRFIFFTIGYDERIEMACAGGDKQLVTFVHCLREAISKSGAAIQFPISYRGIQKLAKYTKIWGVDKAMKRCIIKGLDADNISILSANMECYNKYAQAFRQARIISKAAA